MEWTNKIESVPRNGDFVILQDSLTGSWEVGRWVEESKNWVQIDGSPLRLFATHWMPVSHDPIGSKSAQRLSLKNRRRLILALTAVLSIGGGIAASDLGIFDFGRTKEASIDKKVSSEPEREQSRALANVPGRELAAAREEAKNNELERALAESTARADKLADKAYKLAKVLAAEIAANIERVNTVQSEPLQAKLAAEAKNKELKQALDDSTARAGKLTMDLAAATAANSKRVSSLEAEGLEFKSAAEAKNKELERALAESTARADKLADKAYKLAKVLAAEIAANIERVNTVQSEPLQAKLAAEAKNKELKQALDDSTARAGKLTMDLAAATAANSKRVSSLEAEGLEFKSAAEAKNKELKQALDDSSVRADKLAKDLAAETAANTKRTNALQAEALQAKLATEAEAKELKQAFDEEKAKTEALAGELKSARENIAVAEKSRSVGIAAQTDVSPTGSIDRAVQRANAAPADAVADVSRPPSPSLPKASLSSTEEARLVARANSLIEQVDIADARLLLKYGSDKGSARATFMLAETYDSRTLRSLQAYGVSGDTAIARKLYELAAAAGIDQARERLETLNAKSEH